MNFPSNALGSSSQNLNYCLPSSSDHLWLDHHLPVHRLIGLSSHYGYRIHLLLSKVRQILHLADSCSIYTIIGSCSVSFFTLISFIQLDVSSIMSIAFYRMEMVFIWIIHLKHYMNAIMDLFDFASELSYFYSWLGNLNILWLPYFW